MSYTRLPSFVLGFHGCNRSVAERVIRNPRHHLRASENDYDWLGHGIYFWENNPVRAMQWAKDAARRARRQRKSFTPAVIGAVIDMGHCLDLLNSESIALVQDAYHLLRNLSDDTGVSLPENRDPPGSTNYLLRQLDCAVINSLHRFAAEQKQPPFDSVRAAFLEGEPIYPQAGFRKKNHIQICVRNVANIRGYFYPIDSPP